MWCPSFLEPATKLAKRSILVTAMFALTAVEAVSQNCTNSSSSSTGDFISSTGEYEPPLDSKTALGLGLAAAALVVGAACCCFGGVKCIQAFFTRDRYERRALLNEAGDQCETGCKIMICKP